jgi:transposase
METVVECAAGLDVHRDSVVATIRRRVGRRDRVETKTFETYPDALAELAQWLRAAGAQLTGMEATGVYFKPVYQALCRAGLSAWVVNAAHVKQVPGRKTDVNDSAWLSKLVMYGLVRPSFIPDETLDSLRVLTRLRRQIVGEMTRAKSRLIKLLEASGIKLAGICTDVLGKSGRAIVRELLEGTLSAEQMAALAQGRLRAKHALLVRALGVRLGPEAKWVLRELLAEAEHIEQRIARLDERIRVLLANHYEADVALLRQIPGLDTVSIAAIVAEIGADMSVFASAKHLSAWAGLAPGKNESAGRSKSTRALRGNPWVRIALVQIAWVVARTKRSCWRPTFARLARTTGSAKKAAFAIARKILVTIYHVLSSRMYRPLAPPPLSDADRRRRAQSAMARLTELGFQATLTDLRAEAAPAEPHGSFS